MASRTQHASLELARAAAVDRSDQLGKRLHAAEIALKRTEARANQLRERYGVENSDQFRRIGALEDRIVSLEAQLESERRERTIAESALNVVHNSRRKGNSSEAPPEAEVSTLSAHG